MGRYTYLLTEYAPNNGNFVKNDGSVFNIADALKNYENNSFFTNIEAGNVYNAFYTQSSGTSVVLKQSIAENTNLFMIGMNIEYVGDSMQVIEYSGATINGITPLIYGKNLDRRITANSPSHFVQGNGRNGGVEIAKIVSYDNKVAFIDSTNRRINNSEHESVYQITPDFSSTTQLSINIIWAEFLQNV